MSERVMLYVEFNLARSLVEAIECMKHGGSVWQEYSDDFPDCGGFDTSKDLIEMFLEEVDNPNLNFESELLHLIPDGEEEKTAKPFEIGETVWAIETYFPDKDHYVHAGDCNKIINIDYNNGKLVFDGDKYKSVWWDADKFCRCVLPIDRKKVYILTNMENSVGVEGVYENLELLKEHCENDIIWSDEYEDFEAKLKELGILNQYLYSGKSWDIEGINSKTAEFSYGIKESFLRTR